MKQYTIKFNIGNVKYALSYHDGQKQHKDGSEFWDIETFRNLKAINKREKELKLSGYIKI